MANYFDEHDCVPLGENERPNDQLLLARLLVDSGIAAALNLNFEAFSASHNVSNLPPPTSKSFIENELPKHFFDESEKTGYECPICLIRFNKETKNEPNAVMLPGCGHSFHKECLFTWLKHTSSCPLCRHELPTDDLHYEELKRQKKREKLREQELADLHNSMYS